MPPKKSTAELPSPVGGLLGSADITDDFYEGAHGGADHSFAQKIRENVNGTLDDGSN